jgi:hypothetical protein
MANYEEQDDRLYEAMIAVGTRRLDTVRGPSS